jgi:hypothetical protein
MDKEVRELARELLIEQIKAHMHSTGQNVHDGMPGTWYPNCLKVAKKIIEVSETGKE